MKRILTKLALVAVLSVGAVGCASTEQYTAYTEAQKTAIMAKAQVDAAKYYALAQIAINGDEAAKVAAVMSINANGGQSNPNTGIMLPKSGSDTALQWASVLVPSLTNLGLAHQNARVAITQSNNSASVARSTNETFLGISKEIQAPGVTYNNSYNQDSTHSPTVVQQPAPVIVQQPAPVIVDPVVVQQPAPVIVQQPAPVIVDPVVVNPTVVQPTP